MSMLCIIIYDYIYDAEYDKVCEENACKNDGSVCLLQTLWKLLDAPKHRTSDIFTDELNKVNLTDSISHIPSKNTLS